MLVHELSKPFPDAKSLAIDIETDGRIPTDNHPIVIAISDGTDAITVDLREHFPTDIRRWLETDIYSRLVIGHNIGFDLAFLKQHYGADYPEQLWDTWLAEELVTAGMPVERSLDEVSLRRLGIELDKQWQ